MVVKQLSIQCQLKLYEFKRNIKWSWNLNEINANAIENIKGMSHTWIDYDLNTNAMIEMSYHKVFASWFHKKSICIQLPNQSSDKAEVVKLLFDEYTDCSQVAFTQYFWQQSMQTGMKKLVRRVDNAAKRMFLKKRVIDEYFL